MKDLLKILFMFGLVIAVFIYKDNISNFINDKIIYKGSNEILTYNEYYLNNDYLYVQNIDTNSVSNYQEMLNMFYTIINSGDDSFSFYCNYNKCINDAKELVKSNEIIANINNFVHPYNSFSNINIDIISNGKITVKIKKVYNNDEIIFINSYIDAFMSDNINDNIKNLVCFINPPKYFSLTTYILS